MKKTKDTNKGITLIALVITIIVMLILVAVTITMAVNGGLFEYAGRAGSETNTKRDAEQEYANLQPDMTYDDLINKYTTSQESTQGGNGTITFSLDSETYTIKQGTNWKTWVEELPSGYTYNASGRYVTDMSEYVCYEDGSRVESVSEIISRSQLSNERRAIL